MAFRYLYLDDEKPDVVRSFVREVEDHTPSLKIDLFYPKPFAEQMELLKKEEFDGVILDLRLDQFGHKVGYRATSLAQEIRTRSAEGEKDRPLVLWSTNERIKPFDAKDNTGHDLFDLRCIKIDLVTDEGQAQLAGARMVALAQGYQTIASESKGASAPLDLLRCLALSGDSDFLDPRLPSTFSGRKGRLPAHEFSQFIIHRLLEMPGPLLDEDWIAARLGLDKVASLDFEVLCQRHLEDARYKGVFAQGWPRWWATLLDNWGGGLNGCPGPLRAVPASERVAFLKKHTRLSQLVAATPHRDTDSSAFWTLCRITGQPLDPMDGFVLDSAVKEPWQERLYVSASAAFKEAALLKTLRLSPLEIERFKREREVWLQAKTNR